ncbi:hypothetical protein RSW31_24590, partial [Escherichia coli]|uniref:hypothetical protein n=1 Tax=Escherichia coli TaxID=562 RepID=UPI0028DEC2A7
LHCLVLDGVYRCGADGAPTFIEVAASTDEELHALLQTVIARFMKILTHRGVLVEGCGRPGWPSRIPTARRRARCVPLQAAAITYRIAFGP